MKNVDQNIKMIIKKEKHIALISHDNLKNELIEWCNYNKEKLEKHHLVGTGTTASLVSKHTGLKVKGYSSGPLGGDQQIGSRIVEGKVDMLIFFSDPLTAQPHDPDVKALLRIAQVYDIPIACNKSSADFIINSSLMDVEYEHELADFAKSITERTKNHK